jgi:hypothetical protein
MTDDVEWGPWKRYGQPSLGEYVQLKSECGRIDEGVVTRSDDWGVDISPCPGIAGLYMEAYRIRKPKGLTILQKLISDVPVEEMA